MTHPCSRIPIDEGEKEYYVGRGSFGIVRLHVFRDIPVAVKEFLPRSVLKDVTDEACILSSLCHPYLPYLFGICTTEKPYRLVMQFHSTDGNNSRTLLQELRDHEVNSSEEMLLGFCAQLMEAVKYLHCEVYILHNDITTSNIVIDDTHIVLIDFGKATEILKARRYNLGEDEQQEYLIKYPQLAPEVIDGRKKQSVYSDIYAIGLILYHVSNHRSISQLMKTRLTSFAEKCRSLNVSVRPDCGEALEYFKDILSK